MQALQGGGLVPGKSETVIVIRKRKPVAAVTRKADDDTPPKVDFLRYDRIAGRGGTATVWRAWHNDLKRWVAVKVLNRDFATAGSDVRQFMVEGRTMTQIDHPGIVKGYGAEYADGRYFYIMDFVDGYTFGSLLARKGSVTQQDALIICESVAVAMKYAWDTFRLVHRDIKPENLMIDSDGTVKITDLGLCRSSYQLSGADGDDVVGTPAYISPEQVCGDVELDCRADIYCLGASLYHLATGRMLFPMETNENLLRSHVDPDRRAPDPRRFAPGLSRGFARLLSHMLAKDRDQRYGSWDEVLEAATAVEGGSDLEPLPPQVASSSAVDEP